MNRADLLSQAKRQGIPITDADQQRLATAFHEAGHAVAAVVLSGRVHRALIDAGTPRVEYSSLPEASAAQTAYAGPWAEARWLAGRHPGPSEMRRALPVDSADYAALIIAAGGPGAGHGVVPLLERCWPAVETVAAKLFVDGKAGHRDVVTALGLSDDGGPGSFELACIRFGSPGDVVTS